MTQVTELHGQSYRDYLRVIWTRLWLVALVMVVCAATAFLLSTTQTRQYQASARLMYQPPTDIANPTASSADINTETMTVQLQSVGSLLDSPAARRLATGLLGERDAQTKYAVQATVVAPSNNTSYNVIPNVVEITAETTSPTGAAAIANAYAAAVISLRKEEQQARYRAAQKVVENQLKLYSSPQSKLTGDYAVLTQQLGNLRIAEATATGDFAVVVPATPPKSPSSPQPVRSGALGLAVGLIVGMALLFAMSRLDTRIRTHRQVAEIVELPIIGRLPQIPRQSLRTDELIALNEPEGHVSEALRMLRSNLEWASIDEPIGSLLVTSCLKGEGKTLTVCNLGLTLARAGMRVIIVDADLRAPRVHQVLKLPNALGLTSVVLGRTELKASLQLYGLSPTAVRNSASKPVLQALDQSASSQSQPDEGALWVLTSGGLPPDPGEVAASKRLSSTLKEIAALGADYVLIDSSPILSVGDAGALASSVDGVLLVANVKRIRRPTLVDGRELLDALPCRKVGVVVVGERIEHRQYYQYGDNPARQSGTVPG